MKRFTAGKIILTLLIAALTSGVSFGANTATSTVRIVIEGGDLSLFASDINFTPIDLAKGESRAFAQNTLSISDPTGTGAGWNVTARATDLVSAEGNRIPIDKASFQIKQLELDAGSYGRAEDKMPSGIGKPLYLKGRDQKVVFAKRMAGMGKFELKPNYELVIPKDAVAGKYTSKVTFTIFQGP